MAININSNKNIDQTYLQKQKPNDDGAFNGSEFGTNLNSIRDSNNVESCEIGLSSLSHQGIRVPYQN